ncbi:hypothetical protein [Actinokineospora cianjurensis]|uniref:Uncharacterized protein n=1 Tax=Actinokineospora cianjurensis TaxID=585224 RepID=A0A421AXA7_9PSEU|nr:hypothetical protein [Actinokineospora cianjurensis]RLK54428.1 hypothetical protein CLV68_5978 [Actinokineospora cianjurensis]
MESARRAAALAVFDHGLLVVDWNDLDQHRGVLARIQHYDNLYPHDHLWTALLDWTDQARALSGWAPRPHRSGATCHPVDRATGEPVDAALAWAEVWAGKVIAARFIDNRDRLAELAAELLHTRHKYPERAARLVYVTLQLAIDLAKAAPFARATKNVDQQPTREADQPVRCGSGRRRAVSSRVPHSRGPTRIRPAVCNWMAAATGRAKSAAPDQPQHPQASTAAITGRGRSTRRAPRSLRP